MQSGWVVTLCIQKVKENPTEENPWDACILNITGVYKLWPN